MTDKSSENALTRKASKQKSKYLQARLTRMFSVLISARNPRNILTDFFHLFFERSQVGGFLVSVFMLTWAPVEINNFCNVIGVTKEGFTPLS